MEVGERISAVKIRNEEHRDALLEAQGCLRDIQTAIGKLDPDDLEELRYLELARGQAISELEHLFDPGER